MINLACKSCGQKNEVESFLTAHIQLCANCGEPLMGATLTQEPTAAVKPWEQEKLAPPSTDSRKLVILILGVLNYAFALLNLVCGGFLMLASVVMESPAVKQAIREQHPDKKEEIAKAAAGITVFAFVMMGLSVPAVMAGHGVMNRRPWARPLNLGLAGFCIVFAFMGVVLFQEILVGGIITAYALAAAGILFSPGVAAEFHGDGS